MALATAEATADFDEIDVVEFTSAPLHSRNSSVASNLARTPSATSSLAQHCPVVGHHAHTSPTVSRGAHKRSASSSHARSLPATRGHSRDTSAHSSHARDLSVTSIRTRNLSTAQSDSSSCVDSMSTPSNFADDIESASDAVLSFYFDAPSPADSPDPSELRLPYRPLLHYIKNSDLVREFRHRMTDVVKAIVEIGQLLFPPPSLLDEELARRVRELSRWVKSYLKAVAKYLSDKVKGAYQAFCALPSPCVTDKEELALSIAMWSKILDSLHKPTDREGYVFREVTAIYSSHVYLPFLQLHRIERDHDMWRLEPDLTPVSLLLYKCSTLADQADKSVRAIEEEFELTMSSQSTLAAAAVDSGVFGEHKKYHTPSKSAPVANLVALKPPPRQRENTL